MSVDVDSWSSLLHFYSVKHDPVEANSQVDVGSGIAKLLELFGKHDLKATFFVPGEVAKNYGHSLKFAIREGHELACHGLEHDKNECLLPFNEQLARITEATEILYRQIGGRPKGFRAPCLRANGETAKVLEHLGYAYDSSVLPSFIPGYYGYLTWISRPYHPSFSSLREEGKAKILELPVSVNPVFRIPLSAAWMRNLGVSWVKASVKMNFDMGNPVMFYIHPRDVSSLPKVKGLPWHVYRNVGQEAVKMLDQILEYVKRHGEIVSGLGLAERFVKPFEASHIGRL
jgi:hypothetical protein